MLVVAPLAVLVIATIVGFMVSLVGNVLTSSARAQTQYDTQDALNQIEQDAYYSTGFMSSYTPLTPQGKDNNTAPFTSASGDIIFNQPATDKIPSDPARQIVYYANQTEPCNGQVQSNTPLFTKAIYYLKNYSLYRRVIVPPNNQNTGGSINLQSTCAAPWQRNSCVSINYSSNARCVSNDAKLLDNVSAITITYYNKSSPGTSISDPTLADSIKVSITATKSVGGETITNTLDMAASRSSNITTLPPTPSNPIVSLMAATSTDNVNPNLVTFQWSPAGANYFTVSTSIEGGAWSAPITTTDTSLAVSVNPNQSVSIKVTSYNDMGQSTETTYNTMSPLFSNLNLQTNWQCYDGGATYFCPSFTRTTAGVIVLRGIAKGGTDNGAGGSVIARLPSGFRPNHRTPIPVITGSSTAGKYSSTQLYIDPSGDIIWSNNNSAASANTFLSLDGISFLPQDIYSNLTWVPFTSFVSWTPLTGGLYRTDSNFFAKDSLNRGFIDGTLKATVNSSTPNGGKIASIPTAFTPPASVIFKSSDANANATTLYLTYNNGLTYNTGFNIYRTLSALYYPPASGASWTTPGIGASWRNYSSGSGYQSTIYTKASDKLVTFEGLLEPVSAASPSSYTFFTTASGYRPSKTMVFMVATGGPSQYARVDVQPTGNVTFNFSQATFSPGASWLSLSDITFYADGL